MKTSYSFMSDLQDGGQKRDRCRQHNPDFGVQNTNTQGYKKCPTKPVAQQRESEPKRR